MYAITGITGNVGGHVARNLLAAGQPVRAVVREIRKGDVWSERGCEVVKRTRRIPCNSPTAFSNSANVILPDGSR